MQEYSRRFQENPTKIKEFQGDSKKEYILKEFQGEDTFSRTFKERVNP